MNEATNLGGTERTERPARRFRWSKVNYWYVALGVLVLAGIACSAFFYNKYTKLKTNPQLAAQQETDALLARVGKLMVLPKDETPTVATVSDPNALKDQAFFTNAQKGDKVLIYTNAKKAILYNPTENKIVEVAPVNLGNQTNPTTNK